MGFQDNASGAAATVFLILYVFLFSYTCYVISRMGWKTTYTAVFMFCIIRIGAQLSGVGFSVEGYNNINWLIAYLVLGAEGYFALVLTAFHFLCRFQDETVGYSYLRPKLTNEQKKTMTYGQRSRFRWKSAALLFHMALIPANAILVSGGSMTAGVLPSEYSTSSLVYTGKIMRITGQTIFLVMTQFMFGCALRILLKDKQRGYMLYAVFMAWPFLTVRGIYGVLSAAVDKFNYYDFNNYTSTGIAASLLVGEYVMSTSMEFVAALILLSTFFFRKDKFLTHTPADKIQERDIGLPSIDEYQIKKEEQSA